MSTKTWDLGVNSLRPSDAYMHICVSKLTNVGSNSGLSPGRHRAIIWTNAGILFIGPLGRNKLKWNLNWTSHIFVQENAFEIAVREISAIFSWLQCVDKSSPMAHVCDSNYAILDSGDGLSPNRRQSVICTNAGTLLIGSSEITEIAVEFLFYSRERVITCRFENTGHSAWLHCVNMCDHSGFVMVYIHPSSLENSDEWFGRSLYWNHPFPWRSSPAKGWCHFWEEAPRPPAHSPHKSWLGWN